MVSAATSSVTVSVPSTTTGTPRVGSTLVDEATVRTSVTASMMPAVPVCTMPAPMTGVLLTPANLLPQIPPYHGGEQKDGETFQDWLEHFEAVARWDEHYKLVYLTTALRGTAKSFYRSYSLAQRSSYCALVAELKKRFTPVRLTTQLFHDRRQGPQETVDDFAQDLRRLYSQVYAGFTRGTPEAEKVGQTVLASQFVAGLRPRSLEWRATWISSC